MIDKIIIRFEDMPKALAYLIEKVEELDRKLESLGDTSASGREVWMGIKELCAYLPTLCRIENGIDNLAMAERMQEFAEKYHRELQVECGIGEIISIDGKVERGTVRDNGCNPDIVSAYSYNTGIVLATEACREKSNEIKAVPLLLDKIELAGKIVTADAMSMQKDIIDSFSFFSARFFAICYIRTLL